MHVDILEVLQQFSTLRVLVIGDVMLDSYIHGAVERISPEAPVPIVHVKQKEYRLGGAANVALNLKSLGAEPILCGLVGTDQPANDLRQLLAEKGIRGDALVDSDHRRTTVKTRVVSGSQQLLRFDEEDAHDTNDLELQSLQTVIAQQISDCHAVIFEDYDKGCLDDRLIKSTLHLARQQGIPTIVDPKVRNFSSYEGVTVLKPNLKELKQALGGPLYAIDAEYLSEAARYLQERIGFDSLLVTLSEEGIFHWHAEGHGLVAAHRRAIADVSGAGDTVVAMIGLCTAAGLDLATSAVLANLAGGIVCEYSGVVPVEPERLVAEVQRYYN